MSELTQLRQAILLEFRKIGNVPFQLARKEIEIAISELLREGTLVFTERHDLTGADLEIYVSLVLRDTGFDIKPGRKDLEDFILYPPQNTSPTRPIVLEVKSAKNPSPSRADLRQLDDWVYELSGEAQARREGIPANHLAYEIFDGWAPPSLHPTPHKGLFIFNGPIAQPFDARPVDWLGHNENIFAISRNFCVMSLQNLILWCNTCKENPQFLPRFWNEIHKTAGELRFLPVGDG